MSKADLSVALLHDHMVDKNGRHITASLTLIDLHDLARSSRTYGVKNLYIAHSSEAMRKLANLLKAHWEVGHGAEYNPNRKVALARVEICETLEQVMADIEKRAGIKPILVATSAREGGNRISYEQLSEKLMQGTPHLLMLGTGWGMSEELLARADLFLGPIRGLENYNHLSVRSACAIMLDRLLGNRGN